VERSGAAQGLTEVLCAGGASLVDSVMRQEILPLISHPKASTREGVLWVLTFLPSSLGQAFAPLINSSFPALISGLSDENEAVREVAMRAGRVTIRSHGKAHVDKILPSLEEGLNDEDYRIRSASLNLLGDLLSTIGGTKIVKGDADTQDDIRQAERAQAQIALVLGPQIRKRVLSSLYLRRSDSTAVVRQNAVQVWKTVVSATPRTLRDILDALVLQIVNSLASGHADHTQVAGRCLGDIVGKLGDTVLPEIIPVLRDALYRGDTDTRLGACVGLTEVIGCASREQISKYLDILVKVVQDALCDEIEEVRNIAASCFQRLYMLVGNKALDEIVPVLLASMESADDDDENRMRAMNGLTGILSVRSKELLPILIPRMLRKPITKNQAFGLGSICAVTGTSIHTFFSSIIPSLLTEIASLFNVDLSEDEREREAAIRECVRTVFSSIDTIGVNPLVCEIANRFSSDKESIRKESCWMYQVVIEESK
jgi:HEAT repeat protein